MFFSLQEVVRGGISVSAIFNYRLTPEVSIAVCYTNCPITIRSCIVIYHEWPDNRIVIDIPASGHSVVQKQLGYILCKFTCVYFHEVSCYKANWVQSGRGSLICTESH